MIKFPDVIYLIDDGKNSFWTEYLKRGDKYSTYIKKEAVKDIFDLVDEFLLDMSVISNSNHHKTLSIALQLENKLLLIKNKGN